MNFPFGRTVYRLRAGMIPDPYNPESLIPGDWETPTALEIPGAFVAQTSTSLLGDASREQAAESKSLFCEGSFDVAKGDRILVGFFIPALAPSDDLPPSPTTIPAETVMQGEIYSIPGIPPAADTNPFTGWTPPREIPLTRYVG